MLARKPFAKVRASDNHPSLVKLNKLFDLMRELRMEISFYDDRFFVTDLDRKQDTDWEIVDTTSSKNEFVCQLPCDPNDFKLTQEKELPPKEAKIAPQIVQKNNLTFG